MRYNMTDVNQMTSTLQEKVRKVTHDLQMRGANIGSNLKGAFAKARNRLQK